MNIFTFQVLLSYTIYELCLKKTLIFHGKLAIYKYQIKNNLETNALLEDRDLFRTLLIKCVHVYFCFRRATVSFSSTVFLRR